MVFLLILTLSLVGAVSASDNITVSDDAPILDSPDEIQMEAVSDCEVSEVSLENDNSDIISLSEDDSQDILYAADEEDIHTQQLDRNYELGYEITSDFTNSVSIDGEDILVISNAGISRIDNETTESVLNGIIDASNGYITYEDGNLISLSSTADSVYVAFFVKHDKSFTIALYKNDATPIYCGNVGPRISAGHLEKLKLHDIEIASILSVIDSWTSGNLYDLNICQVRETYRGHTDSVNKINFQPFTNYFASASSDKSISIWDMRMGLTVQTFYGHLNSINDVIFNPRGDMLYSCDADGIIKAWDIRKVSEAGTWVHYPHIPANCIEVEKTNNYLYCGYDNGFIGTVNLSKNEIGGKFKAHEGPVNGIGINLTNSNMFTAGGDGTLLVWQ